VGPLIQSENVYGVDLVKTGILSRN
jgi:hypothetical protein